MEMGQEKGTCTYLSRQEQAKMGQKSERNEDDLLLSPWIPLLTLGTPGQGTMGVRLQ